MIFLYGISQKWNNLKTIAQDWHTYSPYRKWKLLYNVANAGGHCVGLRFLGDTTLPWYSYFIAITIASYFILAAYTIYYNTVQGQFAQGLTCLSFSGVYISVNKF